MGNCLINRPNYTKEKTDGVENEEYNKPDNTGTSGLLQDESGKLEPVSSEKLS